MKVPNLNYFNDTEVFALSYDVYRGLSKAKFLINFNSFVFLEPRISRTLVAISSFAPQ